MKILGIDKENCFTNNFKPSITLDATFINLYLRFKRRNLCRMKVSSTVCHVLINTLIASINHSSSEYFFDHEQIVTSFKFSSPFFVSKQNIFTATINQTVK